MRHNSVELMNPVERMAHESAQMFQALGDLSLEDKVSAINAIRRLLSIHSPFNSEPVDCVQWVRTEKVIANDYNPNSVAPPEMKLLEHSIMEDGYTQPIVAFKNEEIFEVVDGFHRNRVARESKVVGDRVHGYLPLAIINSDREDRSDRIASTIRHNRARGKHKVEAMSDIVIELKRRNWSDEKIAKNLGMDQDEILRLCQITGLADIFSDSEFSKSWDVEGEVRESDFVELTDDISTYGDEKEEFRTVNTGDDSRIFHTYHNWECFKAGFYATHKDDFTKDQCQETYRVLLSDTGRFASVLEKVILEWKNSCEHYLTNSSMNRIAWLGQAALCYAEGIPSEFRGGWQLLTEQEQTEANETALVYLNKWLLANGRKEVSMKEAYSGDRQSDIY